MRTATFCRVLICSLLPLGLPTANLLAQQPAQPEKIAEWVRQLDADEFLTREMAMLSLVEAGPAALNAIAPVLTSGSLEATSRALYVLRQLGATGDERTQDEALALLSQVAERKETPALARRAAATMQEVVEQRQEQSLAALEKLGAKVNSLLMAEGLLAEEPVPHIEIGDDFRGQAADLRHLKRLHEFPLVIFSGNKATDEWIPHAAAMPSLERLHLYKTRLSDTGLVPLADHPALSQLGIYYTPLNDSALAHLTKIPRLLIAKLYGTEVTAAAVEKFSAQAGAAKIDHKRGAFLGVGCIATGGACQINSVHRGSPAEQGGLLPSDLIVRFGESKITEFDGLMTLIAQKRVGDSVEVEVLRHIIDDQGGQARKTVVATVKFAPWDMAPAILNPVRR